MEPITCLHECCEAAAIRAACSKIWAGGGFSATRVSVRCSIIRSTTAYSVRNVSRILKGSGRSYGTAPGRGPCAPDVKGRAFGSPLARGLYIRASTAEADPQAQLGALTRDINTRLSTAENDPQTKPGGPAAAPAAGEGDRFPAHREG